MGIFFSKNNSNCPSCPSCNVDVVDVRISQQGGLASHMFGGPDEFGLPSGTYRSPSYMNCLNKCKIIDQSDLSPRPKIVGYRTPSFQSCIDTCTKINSSEGFINHYDKSFSFNTILLYIFMILLIYFIVTSSSLKDNI